LTKYFFLSLFPVASLPKLFVHPISGFKARGESLKILDPNIANRHE